MLLSPGQQFGNKYRIVRLLGEGSMGAVYEGENVPIRRRVAIKVLHAGVTQHKDTVQRFEREAQAAGRIGSEHIVEVLDLGELPDGSRYLVMELLEGMTLADRIRERGRLTPEEAGPIAHELLGGLAAAHDKGIIHRDLKPANVFLVQARGGQPDFVKILDFGVSKFSVLNAEEASMTRTGAVLGTPFYMSPEQAKGERAIDPRSDLYAVGVILYECVTGQVPFHAETFNELLFKIVLESPPPAESFVPDLDPSFAAILRKSMDREPVARFQTALEFQQAIGDWIIKRSSMGMPIAPSLRMAIAHDQTGRIPWTATPSQEGGGPAGTVMLDLPPPSGRRPQAPDIASPESIHLPVARGGLLVPLLVFGAALFVGGAAAAVLLTRGSRTPEDATAVPSAPEPPAVASSGRAALPESATAPADATTSIEPPPKSSEPEASSRKKAAGRSSAVPVSSASAAASATAVPSGRHISDDL